MRAEDWDGIYFLRDSKQWAFRGWLPSMVPRVGDWVVFPPHGVGGPESVFKVTRVLWRETTGTPSRPYAECVIEPVS